MSRTSYSAIALSISLAVDLSAQVSWTRFEERASGRAAPAPQVGNLLYFGGEDIATSRLLSDPYLLAGSGWARQPFLQTPSAVTSHAIASLPLGPRPIVVVFGGRGTDGPRATHWQITDPTNSDGSDIPVYTVKPTARYGHGMAADTNRNLVFLFGGFDGNAPLNDTWVFDPRATPGNPSGTWAQVTVGSVQPSARIGHAMTFDPVADRAVVYGGAGFQSDTWLFDPAALTWSQITGPGPSPRRGAQVAFHPGHAPLVSPHVVLFGGQSGFGQALADTWILDSAALTWSQASPATSPPARYDHAMSLDENRTDVVMVGGRGASGQQTVGTWEWTGSNWLPRFLTRPRGGAAMTYRGGDGRHVLFGGHDGAVFLADTLELDGLTWIDRTPPGPASSPSARADAGLAFDAGRGRTVLFGGRDGAGRRNDTWEWDGTSWQQRSPPNAPPAVSGVQPVYDPVRGKVWMFAQDYLWDYDGATWTDHPAPTARVAKGVLDTVRNRVVVVGGDNDVWEWDGARWYRFASSSPISNALDPALAFFAGQGKAVLVGVSGRQVWSRSGTGGWSREPDYPKDVTGAAIAYDSTRQRLVVYGGDRGGNQAQNFMCEWDGVSGHSWSSLTPTNRPAENVVDAAMAYDPVRQKLVLFGGDTNTGTWEWTSGGTNWSSRSSAHTPPLRTGNAMFYDPARGIVLYGGRTATGLVSQFWTWDGNDWTQLTTGVGAPSVREYAVACKSPTGSDYLVFGGQQSLLITRPLSDLRQWNGTSWSLLSLSPPQARREYGATYDPVRDRVVMFGGSDGYGTGPYYQDTWEWDGRVWVGRAPLSSPPARARCKMVYDTSRQRIVMFGGTNGSATFGDTWEWDGDAWTQRSPDRSPPATSDHALSYDVGRAVTVIVDATGTLEYRSTVPATQIEYWPACTTALGTPLLQIDDGAGPWLGAAFPVGAGPAPAGAIGFLAAGFSRLEPGIPLDTVLGIACELHTSIDFTFTMVSSGSSVVTTDVFVPDRPDLAGVPVYLQAAIFGNQGWGVTNAVQCRIGGR